LIALRNLSKEYVVLSAHLDHLGIGMARKGDSIYNGAYDNASGVAAILEVASSLESVRVIGGKLVINIVPEGAPHKGIALESVRRRLGCDTALYVGDDETDEDVFALEVPGRLLGIRVGGQRSSLASYCLRSQKQVDDLLEVLSEARNGAV